MKRNVDYYHSPIGTIKIEEEWGFIVRISFEEGKEDKNSANPYINKCKEELEEYFSGLRKEFTIKYRYDIGTEFQKKVWEELKTIKYGTTKSYKEIAEKVDNIKAVRMVGEANNRNPLPIIIPCHRVIGKKGKLVGYIGGIRAKEILLNIEKANIE